MNIFKYIVSFLFISPLADAIAQSSLQPLTFPSLVSSGAAPLFYNSFSPSADAIVPRSLQPSKSRLIARCGKLPIINKINSQTTSPKGKINKPLLVATTVHAGIVTSTLLVLNKYWYAGYPRQRMGSYDDAKEWMQMDKLGHIYSSYLEARLSNEVWQAANVSKRKSVLLGAVAAFIYQGGFELLDGTSAQYGFSWSDMIANTAGISIYASQQLIWGEQRIQPKLSFSNQRYDNTLQQRVNNLYGTNGAQRFLKDYNGQTYWYSANLSAFTTNNTKLPKWLNIAVGIGATGMLGGYTNTWKDAAGNSITRNDIRRQRQYYLAPDIDFTKIKTKKRAIKMLLHIANLVKLPTPGLLLQGGKLQLKAIAY